MDHLTQQHTAKQIYDNYINHFTTEEQFTLFYTKKHDSGGVELKSQKFESKNEDYCISLLETIMKSEDFLGWPFKEKPDIKYHNSFKKKINIR